MLLGGRPTADGMRRLPTQTHPQATLLLAVAAMAIAIQIVLLAAAVWSGLVRPVVIDGANRYALGESGPEVVRYWLELSYFVSSWLLFGAAVFALRFARRQAEEANRHSRIADRQHAATMLLELQREWASAEMIESRVAVRTLMDTVEQKVRSCPPHRRAGLAAAMYHWYLTALFRSDVRTYIEIMRVVYLLENIGLWFEKRYVEAADRAALIEMLSPAIGSCESVFRYHLLMRRRAIPAARRRLQAPFEYSLNVMRSVRRQQT